ncbi:Hypothetical Protein RSKD131_2810 [Cereibacter sphaeroides KD131]|nr:Hypothetical Protein RSKD131_2810 [Cereibacter sphaeroides KD131]
MHQPVAKATQRTLLDNPPRDRPAVRAGPVAEQPERLSLIMM